MSQNLSSAAVALRVNEKSPRATQNSFVLAFSWVSFI